MPTLARVETKLSGALAFVSGRRIDDLDRLFAPLQLRACGVHGAELRLEPDQERESWSRSRRLTDAFEQAVAEAFAAIPGVLVEFKAYSVTVHFRRAPALGPTLRERLQEIVERRGDGRMMILDAHMAVEAKLVGFDKGSAIAEFLRTRAFRGRRPVFVGDDRTDEDGFAVVRAFGGRAYSVGDERAGADRAFDDPGAVRAWLAEFAN